MAALIYMARQVLFFLLQRPAGAGYSARGQQVALPARRSAPGGGGVARGGAGARGTRVLVSRVRGLCGGHRRCRVGLFRTDSKTRFPQRRAAPGRTRVPRGVPSRRRRGQGGVCPASFWGCRAGLRVLPEVSATGTSSRERIRQLTVKGTG